MQLSLYNEDTFEYFGIVDIPDDVASEIIKEAEDSGFTPEELVGRIIIELYYSERPR